MLKPVPLYQKVISLLVAALPALSGFVWFETCKKIDQKASNESVQRIQKVIEVKQEMLLEERREQKALNKELLKAIQNLNVQLII